MWDRVKNILRGLARKISGYNDVWEQALAQVNAKMTESTVRKTVTQLFEEGDMASHAQTEMKWDDMRTEERMNFFKEFQPITYPKETSFFQKLAQQSFQDLPSGWKDFVWKYLGYRR
jgi:hypothetical protein